MGLADQVIRILISFAITALYFMNIISGGVAIGLLVLSGIFLVTSLISFCPLYTIFGWSTRRKEEKK